MADDPLQVYLSLADNLFDQQIPESALNSAASKLPALELELLHELAKRAEALALIEPRRGWAIAQVAESAAGSRKDPFIQPLAAWYLGRASNHWGQPRRVNAAISRARRGFEALNENGWAAACDWQSNVLSWAKTNFQQSEHELEQALAGLQSAGFDEFVPGCQLDLAYAQILIGEHQAALENIRASEEAYKARGDQLNQARCWLHEASSLRRRDRFDEALAKLEQALRVFEMKNSVTDQAKAHYQIALGDLLRADNLTSAEEHFKKAAQLFDSTDLDLWRGMCVNNLGSVYLINGQLRLAEEHYEEARAVFIRHEIQGLLADNLNDSGKLNALTGKAALSVEQFKQSEAINEKLGSHVQAAISVSNLGEAYAQLGRYQDALYHLERAAERLAPLGIYFRLATCEKYMALIWLQLGQPQTAHEFLDKAAAHYGMADQKAFSSSVENYRAAAFLQEGKESDAIRSLERSLDIAIEHGMFPQVALARRLLGEVLVRTERRDEGANDLEQARSDFAKMGMMMEHAACMVSIGTFHALNSKPDQAKAAFEEALELSGGSFPEIDWRAYVELGDLAGSRGDIQLALQTYHQGVNALAEIRRNFLQPSLAGSYLQRPARVFNKIISTASKAGASQDALYFIEESKASTLLRNLSASAIAGSDATSGELDSLRAEIELMRTKLRTSLDEMPALQSAFQSKKIRSQLIQKVKQYDALKTRFERQGFAGRATTAFENRFDLALFQKQAFRFAASDWVALDYYMKEDELITVIVTPDHCQVHTQPTSKRFEMALRACDAARQDAAPLMESDLKVLGAILLPSSLTQYLTPRTHLLVSPHGRLHQVPWPALQPDFAAHPLVSLCIPVVVPSLEILSLLWERSSFRKANDRSNGLLVGLSTFKGLREELPLVKNELTTLHSKSGFKGRLLAEEEATWKNLLNLINEENNSQERQGLARFAWLHIASHFFTDRQSGRLSGIALGDGDIWLDQLRDLSPLPDLVSLSACNSNDSFLYEGDERVDLQTTCFIAGANSVVGNAWPVLDDAAAKLMILFYDYYLTGSNPAEAAARAQRQFIEDGRDPGHWASFVCAGVP